MIKLKSLFKTLFSHLLLLSLLSTTLAQIKDDLFPLSIVHINDFHARFEESDSSGGTCDGENCIGGYARTMYTVRQLMEQQKDTNPVYINAGDNFQGTLWYNVGRWNVTSQFLNMYPAEAMTLGNHEFDHGIEGVVPFLENLNTTMLVANMDITNQPSLEGTFKKSMVIERSGRKIGLIGVILETTNEIANTEKLTFSNESDAVREEAKKLRDEHNVNIIIVISHCGYDVDKIIARNAGLDVDVIVGAHSHTFLYTGNTPPGPDKPGGDYPTEIIHESGKKVLIVQAGAYAKYVGNLTVWFNADGNVVKHEGDPIYMSADVPQDIEVLEAMQPWKDVIDVQGNRIIGTTKVKLDKSACSSTECNLGNFFTDTMIHAFVKQTPYESKFWSNVSIGLVNVGGLRVPLEKGNLTYAHLVTMSPFENILTAFNLYGSDLVDALEFGVSKFDLKAGVNSSYIMLQVSGLKIVYNVAMPVGERVISVLAKCSNCEVPIFEPLQLEKIYRIVSPSFLAGGGDGFSMIRDKGFDFETSVTDLEALTDYVETYSPIITPNEGRIVVLNK